MSPSGHDPVHTLIHNDDEQLIDISQFPNRVGATLDNKTIFMTGGTGYLGKALVEKILHYSNVKKIYVLIKPKRGKTVAQRMETYFDSILFDSLRQDHGIEVFKKVEAISGDISEIGLKITREDRIKLIKEVNIIFHAAASVRFDEMLKKIILLNVRGTKLILTLAKEIENLQLFCHISTTFCVPPDHELPEGKVPVPFDPHDMIKIAENLDNNILNALCEKITSEYGNTYGFTKALAEGLIYEQETNLPVMIIRPSIVLPIWRLPRPGFFDSLNGPLAIWILYGKGLLRSISTPMDTNSNYVPLDSVTNATLISVYNYLNETEMKTMECNASNLKPTMSSLCSNMKAAFLKSPFKPGLGYPAGIFTRCVFLSYIVLLCLQLLPCVIIESLIKFRGGKPKLMMIQKTLFRSFLVLRNYTEHSWPIKTDHFRQLRMNLNDREDAIYPLCIEEMDIGKYSENFVEVLRTTVFHENSEQVRQNLRTLKRYYIIHIILKYGFYFLVANFAYFTLLPVIIRFLLYIINV